VDGTFGPLLSLVVVVVAIAIQRQKADAHEGGAINFHNNCSTKLLYSAVSISFALASTTRARISLAYP
jgi:hypothetical protein